MFEPFGMFSYIGMIGRTLVRDIQSNVDFVPLRRAEEVAKIVECAKLWMDRLVSTFLSADRPRTPGLAGLGCSRIVFALAKGLSDRMNRREVEDVEAHCRDFRQDFFAVLERAVGSRKHLVPGAETCPNGIYRDAKLFVMRGVRSIGIRRCKHCQSVVNVGDVEFLGKMLKLPCIRAACTLGRVLKQGCAYLQVDCNVLVGGDALTEVLVPCLKKIDPGADRVEMLPEFLDGECAVPMIVPQKLQRDFGPLFILFVAMADHGG